MNAAVEELPDEVLLSRDDGVLTITLNRPTVRNAINHATAVKVAGAIDELDGSEDLHVGVITGNGPGFCSGMDLKSFLRGEKPVVEGRGFAGLTQRPPQKPLIAAVEGFALAGGCEIVLACDMVVAARSAIFGLPEVKRGLVPAAGGLLRLPSRIPYQVAVEAVLTGDPVSAERGHEVGLVNILTDDGTALVVARELATRIAANAPLAVRACKQILSESAGWPEASRWDLQERIAAPVRVSADAREGALAFGEKRAPRWRGR